MVSFIASPATPALYLASSNDPSGGAGWWGFLILAKAEDAPVGDLPASPVPLSTALTWDHAQWRGCLVHIASGVTAEPADAAAFKAAVAAVLDQKSGKQGGLVFFRDETTATLPPDKAVAALGDTVFVVPFRRANGKITPTAFFDARLTPPTKDVHADFSTNVELVAPPEADETFIRFVSQDASPVVQIYAGSAAVSRPARDTSAALYFEGPASGAFVFDAVFNQNALTSTLNMGFQLLIPNPSKGLGPDAQAVPYLSAFLPLAQEAPPDAVVAFRAQVNILNPNSLIKGASETAFFFQRGDGAGPAPVFTSCYRTNFGRAITLQPVIDDGQAARLSVDLGAATNDTLGFRFTPYGDFTLGVEGAVEGEPAAMMCGLSGVETVSFLPQAGAQAGERLRFHPGRPAYAPVFPLAPASPVGPPIDPGAPLLDTTFRTAWASFVSPPSVARSAHYAASPQGADLFGHADGGPGPGETIVLGPKAPGVKLDESLEFPLFPFARFKAGEGSQVPTRAQMETLSSQVIGPTRKAAIDAGFVSGAARGAVTAHHSLGLSTLDDTDPDALEATTTPTGFMTRYAAADASWKQLLLAQLKSTQPAYRQMGFTALSKPLQAAFQTRDQFLIVNNNNPVPGAAGLSLLGAFTDPEAAVNFNGPYSFMAPGEDVSSPPAFYNRARIGQWDFTVRPGYVNPRNPGSGNTYGDYRSVMIVKGVKGRILDLDADGNVLDSSLAKSPDKWTMAETFAVPGSNDPAELIALSGWLVEYCKAAWDNAQGKTSETGEGGTGGESGTSGDRAYFEKFAKIITDENWTGVLCLKAAIADIPADIVGLLAGVKDYEDFYAHHLGVEIGQIDGQSVQQSDTSSMFGLIYYVDPAYDDTGPAHTIQPRNPAAAQDFTLLTLKALFVNSAVTRFESLAQMVLNALYGSPVEAMYEYDRDTGARKASPNPHKAILLQGGLQKNDATVIYSLAAKSRNKFVLNNTALQSVEIDSAQMSTRDDGAVSKSIVSWISMTGSMNFAVVRSADDEKLPAFDILSFGPEDDTPEATAQGLSFANLGLRITAPADPEARARTAPLVELVESEIVFNAGASHAREASLFKNFQMEIVELISGDAGAKGDQKSTPDGLGYLPVATRYGLRGVGSAGWHGLRYKLNLGTPGALAGKVNLESSLLISWSDESGASDPDRVDASVNIQLPGAGGGGELFSLQTVIKLSIGLVQLLYAPPDPEGTGAGAKKGGFMLVLNEIALKLFGLLKIPPSGNTAFLLFGDPDAADSAGLGWFAIYNQAKEKQAKDEQARALTAADDERAE